MFLRLTFRMRVLLCYTRNIDFLQGIGYIVPTMKHERWIDANGVTVYEKGRRSSKNRILLTREELLATKILLSGTVTKILTHNDGTKKSETVFKAPFKKA